jgi:riboflavin synthase
MFTGIIETVGQIKKITSEGSNKSFWIESALFSELKVDQSVSHNGVCLTVEELADGQHKVTAIKETLEKTNVGSWVVNTALNLERSLHLSARLDGHFVQGHADTTGALIKKEDQNGSWILTFEFPKNFRKLIIEKGSISLNGISLTIFNVKKNYFSVAVIPYTWQHTNLRFLKLKDDVNLEFDMIGKYIARKLSLKE